MNKRIALVIGVNSYPWQPLEVCVNDAHEMMAVLSMPEYGFEVYPLLDFDAKRKQLLQKLDDFFRTEAETYLLYFTGHGLSTDLGAFICPVDIDVEREAIDLDLITKYIQKVVPPQASVILILDCCHAGAAKLGQSVALSRPLLAKNLGDALPSLSKGRVLFAACCDDEAAFTSPEVGHSLFTSFILRGLLSEAADPDGRVTVSGLYDFVSDACSTSGLQTPVFKGEIAGAFVLANSLPPGARRDLPEEKVLAIEREAENHLATYQNQLSEFSRDLENWKTKGHRSACQMLDPFLAWLDEKKSTCPTLLSRQSFMRTCKAATQRLAMLSALEEGMVVGKGVLHEKLGSGLFGTVWRTESGDGVPPVAYKVYHPQDLHIADKMRRFERGYRAMRQLDHPFIVKVHDYTNCPRGFYMDYIHGANLREFMAAHVTTEDRLALLALIADTLRHSHSRKVCHRDVKPENILVTYDIGTEKWQPYLTDFDLAWFPTGSQLFTKTAMGSLYYAAPEQITKPTSAAAHDYKVDLFSFGQLAYFVATEADPGPLGVGDHAKVLEKKLHEGWNAGSAGLFFELFSSCTQNEPSKRPADFSEVCEILYKISQSYRQISSAKQLPVDSFLRELVFAMVGLDRGMGDTPNGFRSTAQKTEVRLHVRRETTETIDLQYEFHSQVEPKLDGISSYEDLRRTLAGRIENAIREFPLARKRQGNEQPFQIFVDHERVPANREGLISCHRLLSRVLQIIEGT
jgi:serine/threonine protein kinase